MAEPARPMSAFRRFVYWLSWLVTGLVARVCWRLSVHGKTCIPAEGAVLLAANHASYLDPILLGHACRRRVHFMARVGLGRIPILGWWMHTVGVIFVDSEINTRGAVTAGIGVLLRGEVLAIFPEGSRTETGQIGRFQRGILLLLKKSGATVVPAGIRGSFHAFPPGRTVPRPWRCAVHFGEPMSAADVLAEGGLEILRQRVSELSATPLADLAAADAVPEPGG